MEIIKTIGLILGGLSIMLFLVATVVVVYDKTMTTAGRIFRIAEILIFPALGPIAVLLEVIDRREREKAKTKKSRQNDT